LYAQKKIKEKKVFMQPVERGPISFLRKTPKKAKKRTLSSCGRLKMRFHEKLSMPGILEFFLYKMRPT
jgi:hypothetical protein